MDYYWMSKNRPVVSLKGRTAYFIAQEQHLPKSQYGLLHFLAYIFYPPLYIAGPIVSYNAFTHQVYTPQTTYSIGQLVKSTIRIFVVLLGLEVALHYIYFHAFNENDLWMNFKTADVCITGYFVLNFMYTKFLIIWRLFRLGAQYDGIDTPENMNRCVNNNYTFTGFWRSWHGSFNTWTVRYLYIPLGGKKTQKLTMWLIFTFIGLWHDLWWSWVAWALLNCVFFSAEIFVMTTFHKIPGIERKWYYRYIVAVAGTFNVFLLMIANLAILHGFQDSYTFVHNAFLVEGGLVTFVGAYIWLLSGVLVMGEIRESERRNADQKKILIAIILYEHALL
jgi:D-alanyl-lipoteichoic acid acyltransferase DltB (MBOAT superfamily)